MTRRGLECRGYPSQSAEQERVRGIDCCVVTEDIITPEDHITANEVSALNNDMKEIARLRWKVGNTENEIANIVGSTRAKIRTRVRFIKEIVAEKALR